MNTLSLDLSLAKNYKNNSQKIRVMTESWVQSEIFCPNCGAEIQEYENNRPVADFFCANCREDYELKSKKDALGLKIVDGAFSRMIERLNSQNNPNFFFLNYKKTTFDIYNFIIIPKHFFVPNIIEKRNPLALTAKRAGWVGCNILLNKIPESGKIFYVKNGEIETRENVLKNWKRTLFLRDKPVNLKGWTLEVMKCLDRLGKQEFFLDEVYVFDQSLAALYPENKHVKDKIRQQLQILRDNDYLEFIGRGRYRLK